MSDAKPREFSDLSGLVVDDIFVGHGGFRLTHLTHTLPKMKDNEIAYALVGYLAADGITPDIVIDSASDYFLERDERITDFIEALFSSIRKDAVVDHPTSGERYSVSHAIENKLLTNHKNVQSDKSKVKHFSDVEGMVTDGVFVGNSGFDIECIRKQDAQTASLTLVGSLHSQSWSDVIYDAGLLLSFDTFEKAKWIIQDMMLDIARHGFLDMSSVSGKMLPVSESIKANVEKWFDEQPASKAPINAKTCGAFSAIHRLVVRDQFVGCTAITQKQIRALNYEEEMAFAIVGQLAVKPASEVLLFCDTYSSGVKKLVEENIKSIAYARSIKVPWGSARAFAHDDIFRNCEEWKMRENEADGKPSEKDLKVDSLFVFSSIENTVKNNVFIGHYGVNQAQLSRLSSSYEKAIAFVGALTHCSYGGLLGFIKGWDYTGNKEEIREIFLSKCFEIATTGKMSFEDGKQYYANNAIARAASIWHKSLSDGEKMAAMAAMAVDTKFKAKTASSEKEASAAKVQRYAVAVPAKNKPKSFVQVVRADSPGRALQIAGVTPNYTDVLDGSEDDYVDAKNSYELNPVKESLVHACAAKPTLVMLLPFDMYSDDAIKCIGERNSLTISSKDDIVKLFKEANISYKEFQLDENWNPIDSATGTQEQRETNKMAIEKPANKPISAKSMIIQDAEDAALRATGKAASRFSRKILVDSLIPKIENPIVQSAVKKFVDSSWGLSVINISFGYFYPLIESRIPMSEDMKAFGSIVAQHMRRDGLSDVIVDLAAEIAGPIKEFLTEQMNMIPKAQLEKILESQKVRAIDDAAVESPAAIDVATSSVLNGKQSGKRQG